MLDIDMESPKGVCSVEGVLLFYQFTMAAMVQWEEMIWMFPKNRGTPKWMVKIMENPIV